ncbi:hypothetical protein Scani_77930 [Streptomyces caniferus]|uniref:Uncharacterized protein n=1 Tax=Streptomyces caniferus TaxID=285557 RepID=A0A640SPZ0_9ACTN|nr:hypothetical protein Scani_77930 [Streptomyces caniferus]
MTIGRRPRRPAGAGDRPHHRRQGNSAPTADDRDAAVARLAGLRAMLGVLDLDPLDDHWTARTRKGYATADTIRDQLQQSGLAIEDTPSGPRRSLS